MRVHDLLAAEVEQLLRQVARALARRLDLPDVARHPGCRRKIREDEIAVAEDGRQQVVEVVRDAAGELPDGFHLLRLAQLGLEKTALGQIQQRAVDGRRSPGGPGDHGIDEAPDDGSIAPPEAKLLVRDPAGPLELQAERLVLLPLDVQRRGIHRAQRLDAVVSQDGGGGRIDVDEAAVLGALPRAGGAVREMGTEPAAGLEHGPTGRRAMDRVAETAQQRVRRQVCLGEKIDGARLERHQRQAGSLTRGHEDERAMGVEDQSRLNQFQAPAVLRAGVHERDVVLSGFDERDGSGRRRRHRRQRAVAKMTPQDRLDRPRVRVVRVDDEHADRPGKSVILEGSRDNRLCG